MNQFFPRAALAAFGIALAESVMVNAADPIRLTCEPKQETNYGAAYQLPVKFTIDLDRRVVELLRPDGSVLATTESRRLNARPPTMKISDSMISWDLSNSIGVLFDGSVDRETLDAVAFFVDARDGNMQFRGKCRVATPVI